MTNEEFENLPLCLAYKNPGSPNGCRSHPNNNDDWDELEDPCDGCCWNKYVFKRSDNIESHLYTDVISWAK